MSAFWGQGVQNDVMPALNDSDAHVGLPGAAPQLTTE